MGVLGGGESLGSALKVWFKAARGNSVFSRGDAGGGVIGGDAKSIEFCCVVTQWYCEREKEREEGRGEEESGRMR